MTNADEVRIMTNEELEEWFWWMLWYVNNYTDSRIALHEWLNKESDKNSYSFPNFHMNIN